MRIIAGTAAGRLIEVPKGLSVRPTPDKVRQAIFNSLGERVVDASVLELFGGSGALGLECASRGCHSVVCVEKSGRHARFIRKNLQSISRKPINFKVIVSDAFSAIRELRGRGEQFDLILADPPFGEKNVNRRSESFSQRLLDDPLLPELLQETGLFVLGHTKRDAIELTPAWSECRVLKHGDSVFRMLERRTLSEEHPLLRPTE